MKRALALLVLIAACSHGTGKAAPTASPSTSATSTTTAAPTATASVTPTSTPAARPVGPVGTTVPSGFHPRSATFISDRTGWVLGASPCPSGKGSCDVIARTRDGGATWRAIPSPRTSPDHLAQIRFADAANGFVTGDQLWATHDGGATWKVVPGSADITELAASAGQVWVNQNGVLKHAAVPSTSFATSRNSFRAASFVMHGALVVASSGTDTVLYVWNGTRFGSVHTPCTGDQQALAGLGSASHWFLVCEGEAGLGHAEKHAFVSTDAGASWTPAGDPPQLTGTDIYVTSDGDFVVDHQEVSVRRAGGWHVALRSNGGVSEGGFESAALGYCIGGFDSAATETMKLTHDAGRTWTTAAF